MTRHIIGAAAVAIAVLAICLALAVAGSQPREHAQLHNPYWPYTVETMIADR